MPAQRKVRELAVRTTPKFQDTKTWVEKCVRTPNAAGVFANVAPPKPAANVKKGFQFVNANAAKVKAGILVNHQSNTKTPSITAAGTGRCIPEPPRKPRVVTGPVKPVPKPTALKRPTENVSESSAMLNSSYPMNAPKTVRTTSNSSSGTAKRASRNQQLIDDFDQENFDEEEMVNLLSSQDDLDLDPPSRPASRQASISKKTTKEKDRAHRSPAATQNVAAGYAELPIQQLRGECMERNLPTNGTKRMLVQRLTNNDFNDIAQPGPAKDPCTLAGSSGSRSRMGRNSHKYHPGSSDFEGTQFSDDDDCIGSAPCNNQRTIPSSSSEIGVSSSSSSPDVSNWRERRLKALVATVTKKIQNNEAYPAKLGDTIAKLRKEIAEKNKAQAEARRRLSVDVPRLTNKLREVETELANTNKALVAEICSGAPDPIRISRRDALLKKANTIKAQLNAAKATDSSPVPLQSSGSLASSPEVARGPAVVRKTYTAPKTCKSPTEYTLDSSQSQDDSFDDENFDFSQADDSHDAPQNQWSGGHQSLGRQGSSSGGSFVADNSGTFHDQSSMYSNNYEGGGSRSSVSGGFAGGASHMQTRAPTSPTDFYEGPQQLARQARTLFGHRKFRECQEDVIRTVMQGKDCFVLMPTGLIRPLSSQTGCRP